MRNNSTWARLPLSPTAWPPEAWKIPLTLLAAFGAVAVFFVSAVIFVAIAAAAKLIDPHHPVISADLALILQVASYLPLAAYVAAVLPPLSQVSLSTLGLRRPSGRDVAIALAGIVVMFLVVDIAGAIASELTHRHDTEAAVALLQQLHSPVEKLTFVLVALVLAPMVEELTFRVFIFNAFTRYTPVWFAALASGLLFGLVHMQSRDQFFTISLPLAVGGVVLAYVYATTRCYWANVLTHAGFNAIGLAGVLVFHAAT